MSIRSLRSFGMVMIAAPLAALVAMTAVRGRADDRRFKPIVEAEMPAGFPQVTPVGEIQVKRYPAYRKAEAGTSGRAFWTLFSHIKENEIAMTAPVEMSYDHSQQPSERTMAFLYGRPDLGAAGREGRVEVVDVPPMTVVSTGVRGARTTQAVAEASQRLEEWLAANHEEYLATGELRVMAYNSPFVPRSRNYFEVEIPIAPVTTEKTAEILPVSESAETADANN